MKTELSTELKNLIATFHRVVTDDSLRTLFSAPTFSSYFKGVTNFGLDVGKMVEVIPSMYYTLRLNRNTERKVVGFYGYVQKTAKMFPVTSLDHLQLGAGDGGVDGIYKTSDGGITLMSCKFKLVKTINENNSGLSQLKAIAQGLVESGQIDSIGRISYEAFINDVNAFKDRTRTPNATAYDWEELDRMYAELRTFVSGMGFSVKRLEDGIIASLPPAHIPRFHQLFVIEWIIDSIMNGMTTLVLLLCARFGKTLMMCELFRRLSEHLGYKIFLMPSHWLSSHTSMADTINSYSTYQRLRIVETKGRSAKEIIDEIENNIANGKTSVVFFSLYTSEASQDNVFALVRKWITQHLDVTMVLTDEADFGAHTERSVKANKSLIDLSKVRKLYLSGTGVSRMVKGATRGGETVDDLISITMTDLQMLKDGSHEIYASTDVSS